MRFKTFVTAALGVAALGLGATYTFSPGTVEQVAPLVAFRSWTGDYSPSALLTGLGGVLAAYAALAAWWPELGPPDPKPNSPTERYREVQTTPPEQVAEDDRVPADALLSTALEDAVTDRRSADTARGHLRETVHAALLQAGYDAAAAAEAIETGAWAEDQRAAAFLGEDVDHALLSRLRYWLDDEGERARRLQAALRETTDVVADATEGSQ